MEFTEFMGGYNQFCENWQRKGSTKNAEFLYNKIEFIPAIAWTDIVETVLSELERFPRVKDFFGLWYAWRQKNSHQLIEDAPEEADCVWCSGTGFLEYRFEELGLDYNGIAPCGYCENWKRHCSPKVWGKLMTYRLEGLEMNGWKWIKPPGPCTKHEALDAIEIAMNKLGTSTRALRQPDPDLPHRLDRYEDDIPF